MNWILWFTEGPRWRKALGILLSLAITGASFAGIFWLSAHGYKGG